jgi:hypothetical protein
MAMAGGEANGSYQYQRNGISNGVMAAYGSMSAS